MTWVYGKHELFKDICKDYARVSKVEYSNANAVLGEHRVCCVAQRLICCTDGFRAASRAARSLMSKKSRLPVG